MVYLPIVYYWRYLPRCRAGRDADLHTFRRSADWMLVSFWLLELQQMLGVLHNNSSSSNWLSGTCPFIEDVHIDRRILDEFVVGIFVAEVFIKVFAEGIVQDSICSWKTQDAYLQQCQSTVYVNKISQENGPGDIFWILGMCSILLWWRPDLFLSRAVSWL